MRSSHDRHPRFATTSSRATTTLPGRNSGNSERLKEEIAALQADIQRLIAAIQSLDQDIAGLHERLELLGFKLTEGIKRLDPELDSEAP